MRRLSIVISFTIVFCLSVTAQRTGNRSANDEAGNWRVDTAFSTSNDGAYAALTEMTDTQGSTSQLIVPQLVDPGFEAFSPARAPIWGWYSDELLDKGIAGSRLVTMTPDSKTKVEGEYSLHIDQMQPPRGRGQIYLAQALRLPEKGKTTRSFDLSVQMRGQAEGPMMIDVYVWEPGDIARVIAKRKVPVTEKWTTVVVGFNVPRGYKTFGIWFYMPRDEEAQLWLDDVRLQPRVK